MAWQVSRGPEVEKEMRHHPQPKASACPYPCGLLPGTVTLPVNLMIISLFEPDLNVYTSEVLFKGVWNEIVNI